MEHTIYVQDSFFNVNSMVMFVSWLDYLIWQLFQECWYGAYYICLGLIFQYEFNSDVCIVIGLPYFVILTMPLLEWVKPHQYIVYDISLGSDFHPGSESEVRMSIFHLCHMLEPDLYQQTPKPKETSKWTDVTHKKCKQYTFAQPLEQPDTWSRGAISSTTTPPATITRPLPAPTVFP